MASTYMNYHKIQSVKTTIKENHLNDDGSEYGVIQLIATDRDGQEHTVVLFYEEPLTDAQLAEPTYF